MAEQRDAEARLAQQMVESLKQHAALQRRLERSASRSRMFWSMAVAGAAFWLAGYTLQAQVEWSQYLPFKGLVLGLAFGYISERSIYGRPE